MTFTNFNKGKYLTTNQNEKKKKKKNKQRPLPEARKSARVNAFSVESDW